LAETLNQLEVCDRRLSALPQVIEADPMLHMSNLITLLVSQVNQHVQGGHGAERLIHDNRAAFEMFKRAIRRTAPNFIPAVGNEVKESDPPFDNSFEDESDRSIELDNGPLYLSDIREQIQK
jgi:hypothetical protein